MLKIRHFWWMLIVSKYLYLIFYGKGFFSPFWGSFVLKKEWKPFFAIKSVQAGMMLSIVIFDYGRLLVLLRSWICIMHKLYEKKSEFSQKKFRGSHYARSSLIYSMLWVISSMNKLTISLALNSWSNALLLSSVVPWIDCECKTQKLKPNVQITCLLLVFAVQSLGLVVETQTRWEQDKQ